MITTIKQFINKLNENSTAKPNTFKVVAKDKQHLIMLIDKNIEKFGLNCNLNYIDVSQITDMNNLFAQTKFNGNISEWNVSNVSHMNNMFYGSNFNGDISNWNVSNVTNMSAMFWNSNFNGDISNWNVSNVTDMKSMFEFSNFKGDISNWNVNNITDINMNSMFYKSPLENNPPHWYKKRYIK